MISYFLHRDTINKYNLASMRILNDSQLLVRFKSESNNVLNIAKFLVHVVKEITFSDRDKSKAEQLKQLC